jgi:hypothetical protein
MNSVDELVVSVEAGHGFLVLDPNAATGTDGLLHMRGVRTGKRCRYASALQLAVRLDLEANPCIVSVADADEIAAGWSFGRRVGAVTGDPTGDAPDMLVIATVGGRTRTQALNVACRDDLAAMMRAARTAERCADLRIAHGIVTDEMRNWSRTGSLLWQSRCVEADAGPEARRWVRAEIDAAGFRLPLGDCIMRAAIGAGVGVAEAITALGCLIHEGLIQVDFDRGALQIHEPLARRRLSYDTVRFPEKVVTAWREYDNSRQRVAA